MEQINGIEPFQEQQANSEQPIGNLPPANTTNERISALETWHAKTGSKIRRIHEGQNYLIIMQMLTILFLFAQWVFR